MAISIDLEYPFAGRWLTQNSPANRVPSHGTTLFATSYAIDFVPVDDAGRTAPITFGALLRPEPPARRKIRRRRRRGRLLAAAIPCRIRYRTMPARLRVPFCRPHPALRPRSRPSDSTIPARIAGFSGRREPIPGTMPGNRSRKSN